MRSINKIIAIVGPTASGKTDVAIEIAKELDGEVISADSRLIYNDFNIGTAKPSKEKMQGITHHMVDVENPKNTFTVGEYKKKVELLIKEIQDKGKVPIIAGGTGFYIKAVLEGLDIPEVEADDNFRKEMEDFIKKEGNEKLHEILKEKDPKTAAKIHQNDSVRMIRALEIMEKLGKPLSEVQTITKPDYDILYIGLNAQDRDFLYERINKRVHIMDEMGLIKEVEDLIKKYGKTLSLLNTLGYKEVCEYLDGEISKEKTIEKIQKNTRNFAKRQLTWFRSNKEIQWFYIDTQDKEEIIKGIIDSYNV